MANNGGFTLTHALPYRSPFVDVGNPFVGFTLTDQRGFTRSFDGNGDGSAVSDMGAYECGFVVGLFFPLLLR